MLQLTINKQELKAHVTFDGKRTGAQPCQSEQRKHQTRYLLGKPSVAWLRKKMGYGQVL